jgi:DNA-binding phage protein
MKDADDSGLRPELRAKLQAFARRVGVSELASRIPVHRSTLSRMLHGHVSRPSLATMECIERLIDDMELAGDE